MKRSALMSMIALVVACYCGTAAAGSVPTAATLTAPTPKSTLAGSTATFTWSTGVSVTSYKLLLGTTGAGSSDIYNSYTTSATTATVTNLPTSGVTIYATLYSQLNGTWQSTAYTYTSGPILIPSVLTAPTPKSTLAGSSATFTWSAGVSVTGYKLLLGTTGAGSSDIYNSNSTSSTTANVTKLPTNGSTVYATLCSQINGVWHSTIYTYTTLAVTPVIFWATPSPIAINTALTATQLNATSEVPGTFAYSPALGTAFATAGTEKLSVTFTPADARNYANAKASVLLSVEPFGVVAWGDSLTAGNQGLTNAGRYPQMLQAKLVLPVVNEGSFGETPAQIGVREGGIPTYVTVSGGVIPASGGVTIAFPVGYEAVTAGGPYSGTQGTILGVHGNVTLTSGVLTFTRTTPGSAVTATGSPSFVVDRPYANYIPIFWEGRNQIFPAAMVLSEIAAQVATVPAGKNYLLLSVINNNDAGERKGGANYSLILDFNHQLSDTYGVHYFDIRKALVDSYDASLITDVSDYDNDEVPTSLRAMGGGGTLVTSIGPTDTTFDVNLTTGALNDNWILTIDTGANAENVAIVSFSGDTVTVKRDVGGNNTSHAAGVAVTESDRCHLNAKGYQVVADAVANYLSAYAK